jgi:hypothetical protein
VVSRMHDLPVSHLENETPSGASAPPPVAPVAVSRFSSHTACLESVFLFFSDDDFKVRFSSRQLNTNDKIMSGIATPRG